MAKAPIPEKTAELLSPTLVKIFPINNKLIYTIKF